MGKNNSFSEKLDTIFLLCGEWVEGQGEDCYCSSLGADSALSGVFDGCGGIGARSYRSFGMHTGAYMASRVVSGAVYEWYRREMADGWREQPQMVQEIRKSIDRAYHACGTYAQERMKIRGSLVRDYPTTAAVALAHEEGKDIVLDILWAGDSRVYLLTPRGLLQATADDVEGSDAMENLQDDGAMTNVLSSDGKYVLHHRRVRSDRPFMVITATDGCFGYYHSPMEFENVLLQSLTRAQSPLAFQTALNGAFREVAGDDYTFGLMSFFFGSFENTREQFRERARYMQTAYADCLPDGDSVPDGEVLRQRWLEYRKGYSALLKDTEKRTSAQREE